ncbi:MAG: preprotein translocase subunit SecE [Actinobacteria bacterium]|nr:preprotein translocase subunit SecE [Actinomycetota bacterium]
MARIRPSKGQTSGEPGPDETGPGGAEPPPVPSRRRNRKSSGGGQRAQPRPRQQAKNEKSGTVTKSVQEGRSRRYVGEVVTELKKVSWPNRAQLFQATAVVLIFVAIVAVYLGVVDVLMSTLVDAIF